MITQRIGHDPHERQGLEIGFRLLPIGLAFHTDRRIYRSSGDFIAADTVVIAFERDWKNEGETPALEAALFRSISTDFADDADEDPICVICEICRSQQLKRRVAERVSRPARVSTRGDNHEEQDIEPRMTRMKKSFKRVRSGRCSRYSESRLRPSGAVRIPYRELQSENVLRCP